MRLSPRQRTLLLAVCEAYVRTGDGVGSEALARRPELPWSAATIRAELGALVEAGLLWAPHASAARRPTDRGLEFYAAHVIVDRQGAAPWLRAVDTAAGDLQGEPRRQSVLRVVGALLGGAALWIGGAREGPCVRAVEVVEVTERLGLAVFVEAGDTTWTALFEVPDAWRGRSWRGAVATGLRGLCVGRTLAAARTRAREVLAGEDPSVEGYEPDDVRAAAALAPGLCAAALSQGGPGVDVAGVGRLAKRLHEAGAPVGDLVAFVEAPAALAEVVDRVADRRPRPAHGVCVCVGPPGTLEPSPPLDHVSLLARRVGAGADGGVLGVLGPARMDFARAVPLVEYAARAIGAEASGAPS